MILNDVKLYHRFDYELMDEYCKVISNDVSAINGHDNHGMAHVAIRLIKL
jgi:hypothetical protein